MEKPEADLFYLKLKAQLADTAIWPSKYLYKFIVPTAGDKVKEIENAFNNTGAVINTKTSSKGKYTSVSVLLNMKSPDAVIEKYKEVGKIDGVISL